MAMECVNELCVVEFLCLWAQGTVGKGSSKLAAGIVPTALIRAKGLKQLVNSC